MGVETTEEFVRIAKETLQKVQAAENPGTEVGIAVMVLEATRRWPDLSFKFVRSTDYLGSEIRVSFWVECISKEKK